LGGITLGRLGGRELLGQSSWTRPAAPLGELSERLAAAAGKDLATFSDMARAILQTIESDKANRYTQGASLGAG
jgi:hypothetical protein